jgi:thiaminase/transcriptional activator TenA
MAELALGAGVFCAEAWSRVSELVAAIVDHPFNIALAAGVLEPATFAFYMVQDSYYLRGFSRALATAAVRAPCPADSALWLASANRAIAMEPELHRNWLTAYGLGAGAASTSGTGGASGALHDPQAQHLESVAGAAQIEISLSCLAYSSWVEATALTSPYPVIAASLLPCFWVYEHVGLAVQERAPERADHPYRQWITAYASTEFAGAAAATRAATERAGAGTTALVREAMLDAFARATELEWLFWDSAWRREQWPTKRWRRQPS